MRVVLYNDTTLLSSHFGPQLVVRTIREQFAQRGVELCGTLHRDALPSENRTLLARADLVLVNGEGSIHHGRCRHLIDIADQYPSALINCVFQDNEPHGPLAKFICVAARETRSARHLKECGALQVQVVPDLMFSSTLLRGWHRGTPDCDLGLTDNVLNRESGHSPFTPDPAKYLKWLTRHRRIVCGRYHAAVACCVLGIPFTCWPSNTWKIEAMMDDIGLPNLVFHSQEEAARNCLPSFGQPSRQAIRDYVQLARSKIEQLFDQLCKPARELASTSAPLL
jgi:hypothetical protein